MMLPVTALSLYEYCKRKLYLERILGLREPLKEPLVLGSIRHAVLDQVNKSEEGLIRLICEGIDEKCICERYETSFLKILKRVIVQKKPELDKVNLNQLEAYKKIREHVIRESYLRARNLWGFISKTNLYGDELWEKLTPRIVSEFAIESERLGLRGIIDHLEFHEHMLVPVELKTGSAPRAGAWEAHKIQLGTYILMLKEMAEREGMAIKRGCVRYLDINDDREIVMNPFLEMKILDLIKEVRDCLLSKRIPPLCGNENKCRICGLREKCHNEEELNTLLIKQ